jgi:hypothetical protein
VNQNRPVGITTDAVLLANGLPGFKSTEDQGETRLRIQRAF